MTSSDQSAAPSCAIAPGSRILLTGATGYVGGRLAPRLLEAGYRLRCLVRSPGKISDRQWAKSPDVEIVQGELEDESSLREAMGGCEAAYYLVHSMVAAGPSYARKDRDMAERFARSAERAGIRRIIYLGGLGEMGEGLSEHLRSRREVEQALASTSVPVTVLRAAMIIGSGSASFEILRYLVERLPIMITPRWVSTESQPIAIRNVLGYLIDCLRVAETTGRTLDIGGRDVMSYRELMQVLADVLGLRRRLILPVPVLTPRLSSLWIHLVTPLDKNIARPLAEGLRNRVVCQNDDAQRLMPRDLLDVRTAFELAINRMERSEIETIWSAAGPIPGDPDWAGGKVFADRREITVTAPPEAVYRAICRVGGGHGWYAAGWLWRVRGWMDRLVGGPGLRRGRRDPNTVSFGETLDFWRVTGIETDRRLELRAEMKLPGTATLEFEIEPREYGSKSHLIQTARFMPRGLFGLIYWYAVVPLHHVVFAGMIRGIRRAAEAEPARDAKAVNTRE
jgi:uncharacterized protein YbjT (DUF2867 family)